MIMRIAILSQLNQPLCYMDNSAVFALHYYDDVLHEYVAGNNSTFTFTCQSDNDDAQHIKVGNKVSFRSGGKDYYLDIIKVKQKQKQIQVTCLSLAMLFALNELKPMIISTAQTFEWYFFATVQETYPIQLEQSATGTTKKLVKCDSNETITKRIYRIAKEFGCEIEFDPILNDDYTLNKLVARTYLAYDGENSSGIGSIRTDKILRVGKGFKGIVRENDISALYTAIQPFGKSDLRLTISRDVVVDGNLMYRARNGYIYAVDSMQRFPSSVIPPEYADEDYDQYIYKIENFNDAETQEALFAAGLEKLKEISEPVVRLTCDGDFDCNIGDSFIAIDEAYNPILRIRIRVIEKQTSFSDPTKNKLTLSNGKELLL